MKSIIISDLHSVSPVDLVRKVQKEEGIKRAVFHGDYDDPKVLKEILDLDIDKIVLIGNHDHAHVMEDEINSSRLRHSCEEYWGMWGGSEEMSDFVCDSARMKVGKKRGLRVVERIKGKKAVYVHGTIAVDPLHPHQTPELWGRLVDHDAHDNSQVSRLIRNFQEMRKRDYWIMFRGHDHFSGVASLREGYDLKKLVSFNGDNPCKFRGNTRYVVSVGGFYEGKYALFDDKKMTIEFRGRRW